MKIEKNILIKIGGSLLAPKDSQKKDFQVVKFLSEIIKKFPDKIFFIVNGTGNVGHGFVKKNELNEKNILILQQKLQNFFAEIDAEFFKNGVKKKDFQRFETHKIFLDEKKFFLDGKKIFDKKINIFGGDILENGKIISSDKIFGDIINFFEKKGEKFSGFFTGDTDGVYDENGKTIEKIFLEDFEKIDFFEKKGDQTGGMKNKFLELFGKSFDEIIIFNGEKFSNWEKIFFDIGGNFDFFTKVLAKKG
ncbi:hypothetical protein LR002_01670 [Candidatus Gracilibacteria bacterium]|nr:hypothetical protein [Candidatus Gracilibacteria bacterium]